MASVMDSAAQPAAPSAVVEHAALLKLPDELVLRVLAFLDVPDLLNTSRSCRRLRALALDPLLHTRRRRSSLDRVSYLLPRRPQLHTLQPPAATIYLTRTHLAARRLHWSLVCIRLNRSLLRRPKLGALVSANIVPQECCRVDRGSGEFVLGCGVSGGLVERRRRVEREQIKEGLRVWLDRKAREICARRRDAGVGVGVLVWRFSRKVRLADSRRDPELRPPEKQSRGTVSGLKRFFEGLGNSRLSSSAAET